MWIKKTLADSESKKSKSLASPASSPPPPSPPPTPTFSCMICLEEAIPTSSSHTLTSCGHTFCKDCTLSYFMTKVDANQVADSHLICPNPYCEKVSLGAGRSCATLDPSYKFSSSSHHPNLFPPQPQLNHGDIRHVLTSPIGHGTSIHLPSWARVRRWDAFLRKRNELAVETDPNKAWCLHCNRGVLTLGRRTCFNLSTRCSDDVCTRKSCSKCGLLPHPFLTCERARTRHYSMYVNANECKRCPGCKVMIEKVRARQSIQWRRLGYRRIILSAL